MNEKKVKLMMYHMNDIDDRSMITATPFKIQNVRITNLNSISIFFLNKTSVLNYNVYYNDSRYNKLFLISICLNSIHIVKSYFSETNCYYYSYS